MHKHHSRKRFGQHFLTDYFVIDQIVSKIDPKFSDHLVEIGPGLGALTIPILKLVKQLTVIEFDRDLIAPLKKRCEAIGDLKIYAEDALQFAFDALAKTQPLRIFGNLPYNISTPLLFHLLEYTSHIEDMTFMLQKEVVDRITAAPNTSNYGRLSIMIQYRCKTASWLNVAPEAFDPPPKVASAIVHLVPYQSLPFVALDEIGFANLVKHAFEHRRKTLKNSLKNIVDENMWQQSGIDSNRRAETLSVKEFVDLSNVITNHSNTPSTI